MATTTNYGWTTPDDTALVKDGASAIRTLGSSVDTTTKNLNPETTLGDLAFRSSTSNVNTRIPIGSSGQHLTVVAGVPAWATASDQTPLTTKGDLLGFSTLDARIPIGANGTLLTADSTESLGLKWAAPAGGGKVLQVVQTVKTDTFTSTSTSFADITGLSVSITPSSATSKVLVLASFMLSGTNGLYLVIARLLRDSTPIFKGDTAGTRSEGFFNNIPPDNNGGGFGNIAFLDSPATTSSTTYKIQGLGTVSSGVTAWYLNRTANDNNNVSGLRGASSIIAMEIGA